MTTNANNTNANTYTNNTNANTNTSPYLSTSNYASKSPYLPHSLSHSAPLYRLYIVDGRGAYQATVASAVTLSQLTQLLAVLSLPPTSYFQVVQDRPVSTTNAAETYAKEGTNGSADH